MEEIQLKDTLNKHWKDDKKGFGFRMLQKMGWKEDKGLGKNESGITTNVKVSKREEGLGLGMEKFVDDNVGNKAWSSTVQSYNAVLDLLKTTYKSGTVSSDSNTVSDSDSKHKSKKARKDKKQSKKSKKNTSSSSSESEDDDGESDVSSSNNTGGMIISMGANRYKKFRESKVLSNKSFEDKRAIFGHSAFGSIPAIPAPVPAPTITESDEEEEEEKEKEKSKSRKEKKSKKEKKESKKSKKRKRSASSDSESD